MVIAAPRCALRVSTELAPKVALMPARRFTPPWTFDEANHACFIVRDGNNFPVAYVYFESEPGRRAAAKLMTKDEARKIANGIAKLPELLRPSEK